MVHGPSESRRPLRGGVVAGLVAGAVMAVYTMGAAMVEGKDLWPAAKMAAAPFFGDRAVEPGFDAAPVVVGLIAHFAVSVAWAIPFALLAFGLRVGSTILLGAVWGMVVWLGMFYVVLPLVGVGEMAAMMPVGMAILEHEVYGLAVGLAFAGFQVPRVHEPGIPGGSVPAH